MIYQEIVKAYRGWRKFEGRNFADSSVLTSEWFIFDSHKDILNKFMELKNKFKPQSEEDQYIEAKLIASIYFLRDKIGEKIKFEEYLKNTIGIDLKMVPEKYIERLLGKIKSKLKELNISYERKTLPDEVYGKPLIKEEILEYISNRKNKLIEVAENKLDLRINAPISVKFLNEDKYWHYNLSVTKEGFDLKVNLNVDRTKHFKNLIDYAIMHELCGHALQLASWKKEILEGRLNEVIGCEEDYGPEIFVLEGVAESIPYYLFEDMIKGQFELDLMLDELEHLVQNNAYCMIHSGKSLQHAVDYYHERTIKGDKKSIEKALKEAKEDSLMKAYRPVYGVSLLFFKKVSQVLPKEKKVDFFKSLYLRPRTYAQLKKLLIEKYGISKSDLAYIEEENHNI